MIAAMSRGSPALTILASDCGPRVANVSDHFCQVKKNDSHSIFSSGSIQHKLDTSITSRADSHLKMVILTQACKTTLCYLFLLVNLVRFNVFTFLELFLHAFSHANIFIAHVLI